MSGEEKLPGYEPMLAAYHAAFAIELDAMVDGLPILEGNFVLEVACGDGVYTPWLARLAGPTGRVIGLDLSEAYLKIARMETEERSAARSTDLVAASLDRLPFPDRTFDAVWCAQSLFSLSEPVKVLCQMARVVKEGGLVAILEDDTLHQILLPWPVPIELAVRTAEWEDFRCESRHPDKYYVGRRMVEVFRAAGLVDVEVRSFASSRVGPLDRDVVEFLHAYLEDLRGRVFDRLDRKIQEEFRSLINPQSSSSFFNDRDLQLTVVDHVTLGRVPVRSQP